MEKKEFKKLCGQIRRSKKYLDWKEKIIKRDNLDIKTYNIHHIKPFNEILLKNGVTTLLEAEKCSELWNISNGTMIKKGEHHILSQLERMKSITLGFREAALKLIDELPNFTIKKINRKTKTQIKVKKENKVKVKNEKSSIK